MLVRDVMHKGIHLVSSENSVEQCVSVMTKFQIGAILIGEPDNLEGIFSERDLMLKVVVPKLPVNSTKISDVMTQKIFTVEETESVEIVLTKMEQKKIRHLPIINTKGVCVGMLSVRDLMGAMLNKLET